VALDDGEYLVKKKNQTQNMNFTHEVRNYGPGTLKTLDIYMAIPGSSDHQTLLGEPMYFSDVAPEYVTDKWGQAFAAFHFDDIESGQKARAAYFVTADIYDIRYFIRPERVGGLKNVPKEIREIYLADDTKFDMDSPVIQNAVKEAVGDETNMYWKARRIYKWVNDTLFYELAGGWNVAPAIIERGNGSCSEYTFVFMSMCRAAGIPARYTGAISVRGDRASEDEVFHRWCEIYLPPYGWIPVDPSRGDTESPEGQANGFGNIGNGLLVTTTGAGSDYIGWRYNSGETWESIGKVKVLAENIGEWTPADTTAEAIPISLDGGQYCRPR
jgi:transglutaminase-like putative cysteine protease